MQRTIDYYHVHTIFKRPKIKKSLVQHSLHPTFQKACAENNLNLEYIRG